MSDTVIPSTAPRKGGRPRNPEPPKNAADVRLLIGIEIVKAKPKRVRALQNLLKSFEDAEKQESLERQNRLQEEANELKRLDYQNRQKKAALLLASRQEPKTIELLNKQLTEQQATIHSLEEEVERLKSEKDVLQQSADVLAQLRAEAVSKVAQALRDNDEADKLQAEWEELNRAPVTQEILDRMKEVFLRMKVIAGLKSNNRG